MLTRYTDSLMDSILDFPRLGNYNYRTPPVDVIDAGDTYRIKMAVPGYKKEDLNITVEDNQLVVEGHSQREEANFLRNEITYGKLYRKVWVNSNTDPDTIRAKLDQGILTITLDKESDKLSKQIKIE